MYIYALFFMHLYDFNHFLLLFCTVRQELLLVSFHFIIFPSRHSWVFFFPPFSRTNYTHWLDTILGWDSMKCNIALSKSRKKSFQKILFWSPWSKIFELINQMINRKEVLPHPSPLALFTIRHHSTLLGVIYYNFHEFYFCARSFLNVTIVTFKCH